jgi:hypothetical protein
MREDKNMGIMITLKKPTLESRTLPTMQHHAPGPIGGVG